MLSPDVENRARRIKTRFPTTFALAVGLSETA